MSQSNSFLPNHQRSTHTYVIGQPGTGKSRAIESWVMQDVLAGRGCAVIDPHGELFSNLIARLARQPKVWPRVVILDPSNKDWAVGINPLQPTLGFPPERIAQYMTDILAKIWSLEVTHAPRLLWLMNNSFLALTEAGKTLLDLPKLLLDTEYRQMILGTIRNEAIRDYFQHEYPSSRAATHQWATPLLNKIGPLIFDSDIRMILAAQPPLNFSFVMNQSKILLANLPKGILGEGASALLGAFVVARIQKAALRRTPHSYSPPFYLYLDEFQNYTTNNIIDILAESRKYALSMTLAHQYLDQLSREIRNAVLNTAGTLVSFRVGHNDATRLVREMFHTGHMNFPKTLIEVKQNGLWPQLSLKRGQTKASNDHYTTRLTTLANREFWLKRRGLSRPSRHKSFTVPDVRRTPQLQSRINQMYEVSGRGFGESKDQVKKRMKKLEAPLKPDTAGFWSQ